MSSAQAAEQALQDLVANLTSGQVPSATTVEKATSALAGLDPAAATPEVAARLRSLYHTVLHLAGRERDVLAHDIAKTRKAKQRLNQVARSGAGIHTGRDCNMMG